MYIKKYLTLSGSLTGTVKFETDNGGTHIHIRITSDVSDIMRAYLTKEDGARAYCGIISENGGLVFETRGLFDAVFITKKQNGREQICASAFTGEEYAQYAEEAAAKNAPADAPAQKGGSDDAADAYAPAIDEEKSPITFHIASRGETEASPKDGDDGALSALGTLALLMLYLDDRDSVSG